MASNTLLVNSYMDSPLQIKEIYPVKVDGSDAIMISPKFSDEDYWKTDSVQ